MDAQYAIAIGGVIFTVVGVVAYRQNKRKERIKDRNFFPAFVFFVTGVSCIGASIFGESTEDFHRRKAEEKASKVFDGVSFSGRTADIIHEIDEDNLSAQHFHEKRILEKIYYIITEGRADRIKITMTDYCKDFYGHTDKRYWHKNLDKSWFYWSEAGKYADADAFSWDLSQHYVLSSDTEEGTFYCCGRDRGCN
jgi:hypothetical protein